MNARLTFLNLTILGLAGAAMAAAQSTGTATLTGAVNDSTGAVIPGANITVINTQTGFVFSSVTTAGGTWYVPNLNPGSYQLKIEAQGFKAYVRDGIVLRTAEQPRIDVTLDVGNVTESIQVTGAPPLLETETAASGQVLEGSTVVKIPVLQKAFYRIYLYMPGMNVIRGQHAVGQRQRSLGFTLDGMNAKEPVLGNPNSHETVITSTLDMIQEFKMWTTGLPAEFGHNSGGQLSGVFKSGTNEFHGSLEDRYLNGALVHRQYFEQLTRCQNIVSCNPFTYHEMGATAGGVVKLPWLYNGKDKTFFFGGVQRHHEKVSETFRGAVPSEAMYGGDFSFPELAGTGRAALPIYDPNTIRQEGSTWTSDPFPGNRIPSARFDPVARNLLDRNPWKAANGPGVPTPTGPAENLVVPTKGRYYFTRIDAKVDHQFNSSNKLFARYSHMRHRSLGRVSNELLWSLVDPVQTIPIDQGNLVISDTHTFNPTTINEFRIGMNRRHRTRRPATQDGGWAKQLGIPNVSDETFPDFRGGGRYYNLGPGGQEEQLSKDFTVQNNLTKISGKHTLKFGYEIVRTSYDALVESLPSGLYNMAGSERPFTPNTGNRFANLLLGTVGSAQFTQTQAQWQPRWWSHSWYVQTDYKPIRNMTLNLGLRWSYETPFQTSAGKQSQFDPAAVDPLTGRLGAIVHVPGALAKRDLNNFQPRIGMAWNFSPRWVFRGNFSIITSDLLTNTLNNNFEEYFATANVQSPPGDPRPAFRLSQGPPPIRFNLAQDGSVPFVGTNYSGRTATWFDPNMRMPYVMNWSSGFQYQFSGTWLAELQYQGSSGVGLLNNWDMNVLPLDVSSDPVRLEQIRQQYQNFRPFSQFGGIQHYSNYGHNSYHGTTLRVEKRYAAGLSVNSFWTFSKSMNDVDEDGGASGITFYNRRLEKARASFDVNHRWVTTVTYELPVGKGRRFLNTGGWKNGLLGGWELVGSQHFQSGPPFTVGFAGSPNRYLPGAARPIQTKANDEVKLKHVDIGPNRFPFSAQNRYVKLDGFLYPDSFQPGTLGRNTLQAPGLVWMQASLSKEFPITERIRFHLRFDVNNLYKYHNFNPPNSAFNTRDTSAFGTFNGTRGSFSDIGTGRWHGIMVFRLEW
ncbi:MAG: carboxypeptidase regulatory-like domain-containing protein [Bryobacteraceae bacterium]